MKRHGPFVVFCEVPFDIEELSPAIPYTATCHNSLDASKVLSASFHLDLLVHRYHCDYRLAFYVLRGCCGNFVQADAFFKSKGCVRLWTAKEDEIISSNCNDIQHCCQLLDNRTERDVECRIAFLGLSKSEL